MSLQVVEENSIAIGKIIKSNKHVRIYVDSEKYIEDEKIQLYLQLEPEAICPKKNFLIKNSSRYKAILTFDTDVLRACTNAIRFTFYTETWIHENDYSNIDTSKKRFAISTLVGAKSLTEGHRLRQILYFAQNYLLSLPFTFYRSNQQPLLPEIQNNPLLEGLHIDAKFTLFKTYQFHLAIENSRQENYFTEKLIDCLITKTIPIYYGCPNIQEYFDTTGWILLESASPMEVFVRCNELHSNYYDTYKDIIDANYQKALLWKENYQRFNLVLETIIG